MAGKKKSDRLPIEKLTRTEFVVYFLVVCAAYGIIVYATTRFMVSRFGQDWGLIITIPIMWAAVLLVGRGSRALVRRYNRHKKSIKKAKH